MDLTQAEIIQVLRRRTNLNQGDFGARAFNTSYESGRTKVKNIELGKQTPTAEDLKKMARALNVDQGEIQPSRNGATDAVTLHPGDAMVSSAVLETFAGLDTYLDMLNKAVQIGDTELIGHISGKAAAILNSYATIANKDAIAGTKG
jgi:transcriptional regulator with XRE-family HTH domain